MSAKEISKSALLTAFISICSVLTVQIGTIPITLGTFACLFAAIAAPVRTAVTAVSTYVLIGACGIPVFSGFRGGIGVLIGPTGGYIISYILMALLTGFVSDRCKSTAPRIVACFFAMLLCYIFGTIHYCLVTGQSLLYALSVCVYPFIPFDILKSVSAVLLGGKIRTLTA